MKYVQISNNFRNLLREEWCWKVSLDKKNIHISLSKVLMYEGGDPEKSRILLRALTGVTATNKY